MKGVITIFLLPFEVEDFGVTMANLKRNSVYLNDDNVEIKLDVCMCTSDEMTDWQKSSLTKEYIEVRTTEIFNMYSDWAKYKSLRFEHHDYTIGCLSHRRHSYEQNPDADFFIWLDTDIVFKDTTLRCMIDAYKQLHTTGHEEFVVTPQIVRQWDTTWDVLVHKSFKDKELNYQKNADIYKDVLSMNDDINILELPTFKFAGGWFTLISKKLIDRIGIPKSFGHYGPDDTFIMFCAIHMNNIGMTVKQFVLENLIIGEKYKYTVNKSIKKYIESINRKDEFRKTADENFGIEVKKFITHNKNKEN